MRRENEARDLIGDLLDIADDLEAQTFLGSGLIRRAARWIAEHDPAASGGCARCGGPVVQPALGRRRKVCTNCRPSRAKSPPNAELVR